MTEILPTNTCPRTFVELSDNTSSISVYARAIHLDIGDGVFVKALSWPYGPGQWEDIEHMAVSGGALPGVEKILYEAHLMVDEPLRLGELLARLGCARIVAHLESFANADTLRSAFSVWKTAGASEAGVSVLLETPLQSLEPIINECDVVQVMSIATLGSQGALFDSRAIERIRVLHATYPTLTISVDGGVSEKNITSLARAGIRRFCIGSAISKAEQPAVAYATLKSLAESVI